MESGSLVEEPVFTIAMHLRFKRRKQMLLGLLKEAFQYKQLCANLPSRNCIFGGGAGSKYRRHVYHYVNCSSRVLRLRKCSTYHDL